MPNSSIPNIMEILDSLPGLEIGKLFSCREERYDDEEEEESTTEQPVKSIRNPKDFNFQTQNFPLLCEPTFYKIKNC
ncbi:hypothetical protein PanWU01x14_254630 [Parasponia andersonii]|uniref:Uncharacterized protein n=1 Tax=Parasponia andersonii TaxID=3476 RepID=A0A2P5BB66_PARAD|nr:hypothetical protein PanWU01x14_254630 [Parasponia andersonii]